MNEQLGQQHMEPIVSKQPGPAECAQRLNPPTPPGSGRVRTILSYIGQIRGQLPSYPRETPEIFRSLVSPGPCLAVLRRLLEHSGALSGCTWALFWASWPSFWPSCPQFARFYRFFGLPGSIFHDFSIFSGFPCNLHTMRDS